VQNESNPYPEGSMSKKIYDNNYEEPGSKIINASHRDRLIIYAYIMKKPIKLIAVNMECSVSTVNTVLLKYGIK